ncbi:AAA family ATPase [Streptomyces sp. WAC01280]|uniref:AAA family ATPase n=1 Tax=Streptomyces sp. WAC01280 TaxID=2487424 RepID=UPI000F7B3647|nr:AAA family ATPase [Streptomyces sp. WAC01280]RSS52764.1 transcriptional regulator [Streptomyces sp. WAC01280]
MKRYGHGLVVGGFSPPHAGHHHLVRTARERCERLTVLVRGSSDEGPPLADRVAWMREIHPDALVVAAADDSPAGLRAAVPEPVDAVFTAEPCVDSYGESSAEAYGESSAESYGASSAESYGPEIGRRFGAETVRVEPDPARFPVTDAAVRADPAGCWDFLEAPVRSALTRRVVVLGAESSGTTTMALALADHYRRRGGVWARTRCVPAYEREFGALKLAELRAERPGATRSDVPLRSSDFPVIAQRQAEREEEAARDGSPVLFCDTDAFATSIRHERYLGTASPETGEIAAHGRQHLWLLTDHRGVDFENAEGDGELLRPWMTARLLTQLAHSGRRTAVLSGPHEERLAAAVAAVDALLAEGLIPADSHPERR